MIGRHSTFRPSTGLPDRYYRFELMSTNFLILRDEPAHPLHYALSI